MLDWLFPVRCSSCGQVGPSPCGRCRALVGSGLPLRYEGVTRCLINAVKFHNDRTSVGYFVDLVAAAVDPGGADLVTWVPSSVEGRRRRGFDFAETLAQAVARQHDLATRSTLERADRSRQVGRARSDRLSGPALRVVTDVRHLRVVLIDDVTTTGATMGAAVDQLLSAGAASVRPLALAATPRRPIKQAG